MPKFVTTIVLTVGLLGGLLVLATGSTDWRLPDNQQGYAPAQPIAYSHRQHAGELQIDCRFCHTGAEFGRHAGIPASDVCLKCHRVVTSNYDVLQAEARQADEEKRKPNLVISTELQKLYDYCGLGADLKPDPEKTPQPIPWVRVHNLPDYACFDHRAHVTAGVTCQKCHGPVESMERMRQEEPLSMGWCVNCHRESNTAGVNGKPVKASLDCAACHY
jgi:hypothetical protein